MEKTKKHSRHSFRSNTLPAVVMTGPMALLLRLLVAAPLMYGGVMRCCSIEEYYNVDFRFTTEN